MIFLILNLSETNKNRERDVVFNEFKRQIEEHNLVIENVDETELISLKIGEETLKISLDNVRKDYNRDNDESYISNFVKLILSSVITEIPSNWQEAKNDILISFFPNNYNFEDTICEKVTDEFSKIYVYYKNDQLTWVTENNLKDWKIDVSTLSNQANKNVDVISNKSKINIENIEGRKLGSIETKYSSFKIATLFSSNFREKIKADFANIFYAVLPVRDFCYIFSEEDFEFFSQRIGDVVVEEYENSGHPITKEVLKFYKGNIESIGTF